MSDQQTKAPMTSLQLLTLRDKLLHSADGLCDRAEADVARGHSREAQTLVTVALARKDLAFTVDTLARKSLEAEHREAVRKAVGDG